MFQKIFRKYYQYIFLLKSEIYLQKIEFDISYIKYIDNIDNDSEQNFHIIS